ncbi:hypothetical protein EGO55_15975 [Caenibius tardaugens NBRC 16725]|nr:hypothetical protein EGO55_15975 [Caenibius tardaugens NBRC 16725]
MGHILSPRCPKSERKVAADPEDIVNWQRLDPQTTTSGLLRASDVPLLSAIGVCHVINLAPDDNPLALPDEAGLLAQAGMNYTYIPVPFDAPTEDHYAAFVQALDQADGPVHVHCIANWRVSAFFYRYHRDVLGMADDDARALLERQWTPETSDNPSAPQWARFIASPED